MRNQPISVTCSAPSTSPSSPQAPFRPGAKIQNWLLTPQRPSQPIFPIDQCSRGSGCKRQASKITMPKFSRVIQTPRCAKDTIFSRSARILAPVVLLASLRPVSYIPPAGGVDPKRSVQFSSEIPPKEPKDVDGYNRLPPCFMNSFASSKGKSSPNWVIVTILGLDQAPLVEVRVNKR